MRVKSCLKHLKENYQVVRAEFIHRLKNQIRTSEYIGRQEIMERKDIKEYLVKDGREPSDDNIESLYELMNVMHMTWDKYELVASRSAYTDEQIHKALAEITETMEITLLAPDRKMLTKMKSLYPSMHCWNSFFIPKRYEVQYALTGSDIIFVIGEQKRSLFNTMQHFCETWKMSLFQIRQMSHLSDDRALEAYQRKMVACLIKNGIIADMPLEGINKEIADFTNRLAGI